MTISIATEAYNLDEGQSLFALRRTLDYLSSEISISKAELFVAVTAPDDPQLAEIRTDYPTVRVVDCRGMSYDRAKMEVARAACGEYLVFLDGDCKPVVRDWLEKLLAPLREGRSPNATGLTIYEGGFLAKVCSILDFGFLFDASDGEPVGCYVSNNFAILRAHLLKAPFPEGGLRCHCYCHAQDMLAAGTPFILAAGAKVEHEFPDFLKERWRRGADFVGETLVDRRLPPAHSSTSILLSAWRIYSDNLRLDYRRLTRAAPYLGLSSLQRLGAKSLMPILRLVDFAAIVTALRATGQSKNGTTALAR